MNQILTISTPGFNFLLSLAHVTLLANCDIVVEFKPEQEHLRIEYNYARRNGNPELLVVTIHSQSGMFSRPMTFKSEKGEVREELDCFREMLMDILTYHGSHDFSRI